MTLQVDPTELRQRYESEETEELLTRIAGGGLEPEAEQIAKAVLAARGVDTLSAGSGSHEAPKGPAGVGGWLLFLVIGLIVLGPVVGLGRLFGDFALEEEQNPRLRTLEKWSTFQSATYSAYGVTAGLSIYAGVGLSRRRDRRVVKQAKIVLWITGPVGVVVLGLFIPFAVFGKLALQPELAGAFIGSVITAGIWTAYLSRSKRVRNTYGDA